MFGLDLWTWTPWHDAAAVRSLPYLLATVALAAWLWPKALQGKTLTPSRLDLPILLVLGVAVLAALTSRYPVLAVVPLAEAALLTLWLKFAQERSGSNQLAFALLGAGGLVQAQAIIEFLRWYAGFPLAPPSGVSWLEVGAGPFPPGGFRLLSIPSTPWTPALVSGANPLGAFIAALMPVALAALIGTRRWGVRAVLGLWCLSGCFILTQVDSRAAWLGAACGCLTLVAMRARRSGVRRAVVVITHPLILTSGALVVIAVLTYWSASQRLTSTLERVHMWGGALRLWAEHPLFGVGPGQYAIETALSRGDSPLVDVYPQAHNLAIHLTVVLGMAGTLCVAWLAWRLIRTVWAARIEGSQRPLRSAGYIGGVVALAAYGAGEVPTYWPLLAATGAALAGMAVGGAPWLNQRSTTTPYRLLLGCVPIAVLGVFLALETSRSTWLQGFPAGYHQQLALSAARDQRWGDADHAFEAAAPGPWSAELLASAAYSAYHAGKPERAIGLGLRARMFAPTDPRYPLLLGTFHEGLGHEVEALQAYGVVLALRPAWVDSGFWNSRDRQGAVREAILWLNDNDEFPPAWREARRVELLRRSGSLQEARRAAETALAGMGQPDLAAVGTEMSSLLRADMDNVAEREHALFDPLTSSLELLDQLGQTHLALGEPAAAADAFERLRERSPGSYAAYEGLATVWLFTGDNASAVRDAKAAVFYGAGHRRSGAAVLGRALLASGRPAEAQVWLEIGSQPKREPREDPFPLLYQRPTTAVPLEEALPRLVPDAEIALVQRDLQLAMAAALRG